MVSQSGSERRDYARSPYELHAAIAGPERRTFGQESTSNQDALSDLEASDTANLRVPRKRIACVSYGLPSTVCLVNGTIVHYRCRSQNFAT